MNWDALNIDEQERIRAICQRLFHENFLLEFRFSAKDAMKKADPDYTFAYQKFSVLSELLDACGWRLHKDDRAGVMYLTSTYPGAYLPLKKLESQFLFALRLIYDDKKMQAAHTSEVLCSVRDIVEKLSTLNAADNITKQDRNDALRTLEARHIIERISGAWAELDTSLVILPSILCVLSTDKIAALRNHYAQAEQEEET